MPRCRDSASIRQPIWIESRTSTLPWNQSYRRERGDRGDRLIPSLVAHVQLCKAKGEGGDKLRLPTWVEIVLLGEDDSPIPGEKYVLKLPGGKLMEGTLDKEGKVRVDGIPPGLCQISFPGLDKRAWAPIQA